MRRPGLGHNDPVGKFAGRTPRVRFAAQHQASKGGVLLRDPLVDGDRRARCACVEPHTALVVHEHVAQHVEPHGGQREAEVHSEDVRAVGVGRVDEICCVVVGEELDVVVWIRGHAGVGRFLYGGGEALGV